MRSKVWGLATMFNGVWKGPVSALRWLPLWDYAADGRPESCSKGHALQWAWGIVRCGRGDFVRTRYRRRLFSASLQEICRAGDAQWSAIENVRIDHCCF
jgi:hypothetical protein